MKPELSRRELDTKLRNDILKLVHNHSKKQGKVLTMFKLKHKENVGDSDPFEPIAIEMRWRFAKELKTKPKK